jgi:hypothetical protein
MRPKPTYGDPCNSCGRCCVISQCPLSLLTFGERTLCPALTPDGAGGYGCGLVSTDRFPPAKRSAAAVAIGAGTGCDFAFFESDFEARKTARPHMEVISVAALEGLRPGARAHFEAWRRRAAEAPLK